MGDWPVLGEVKTSSRRQWPAKVMSRPVNGLCQQLKNPRDHEVDREALAVYLAKRTWDASSRQRFTAPYQRLPGGSTDIRIDGLGIRDSDFPRSTRIRVIAISS